MAEGGGREDGESSAASDETAGTSGTMGWATTPEYRWALSLSLYICTYMYMYVCMYVCMYVYIYIHTYIYTHMNAYLHTEYVHAI